MLFVLFIYLVTCEFIIIIKYSIIIIIYVINIREWKYGGISA